MNVNTIDGAIVLIANALGNGMTEETLLGVMAKLNYDDGDIYLIMSAAKLLHKDRKEAPIAKPMFKRIT